MPAGALMLSGHVICGLGRGNAAFDMSLFQDGPYVLVTVAPFVFGAAFAMTIAPALRARSGRRTAAPMSL